MRRRLAPAKINLALHVTGQRDNGFHELDSLVCFAEFGDELEVRPADELSLTINGPMAVNLPVNADNLVLKAARLMSPDRGVALSLTKNLPVASGIGGGSADAAAALHLLAELWQIPLPSQIDLLKLGADVLVCLAGEPTRMRGIGEDISPVTGFPGFDMVLVNPMVEVATPLVFQALEDKNNSGLEPFPLSRDSDIWLEYLSNQRNDLENPATHIAPEITTVLSSLKQSRNCTFARMSGSGATCFGIYRAPDEAASAARSIKEKHPNWWVQTTRATT